MLGNIVIVIVSIITAIIILFFLLVAKAHKKAPQGIALIRTGFGGAKVALDSGMFVLPILHKLEEIDIALKTINIEFLNKNGLICKDYLRADIKTTFYIRINNNKKDIIEVAQTIGCKEASTQETMDRLFNAKFSEAMLTVAKHFDFDELSNKLDEFKNRLLEIIGTDLNGYFLDDCATNYFAQTSIDALNPEHITDAQAIKKIQEITAAEKIKVNEIILEQEKTLKEQDLKAREVILQLEKYYQEKMEQINKSKSIYDR